MLLDKKAIEDLANIIIGDTLDPDKIHYDGYKGLTPNKSGPQIVNFFNNYGFRDVYQEAIANKKISRLSYAKSKLEELNGSKKLEKMLNEFVYSRNYIHLDFDVDHIAQHINSIIKYNGYELKKIDNEYIVTGSLLSKEEPIQIEATFENIQSKIIDEIRNAKYIIWIAVAWFTDRVIFDELIQKKQEGLNIQVIVSDDGINSSLPFVDHFETFKISPYSMCDNIFHEKFCIIDLQTVIHGSYNWSKKAQYNKEDITTTKSYELAQKYADRFKELKLLNLQG